MYTDLYAGVELLLICPPPGCIKTHNKEVTTEFKTNMADCKRSLQFVKIFLAGLNVLIILLSLSLRYWLIGRVTLYDTFFDGGYLSVQVELGLWKECSLEVCGRAIVTGKFLKTS